MAQQAVSLRTLGATWDALGCYGDSGCYADRSKAVDLVPHGESVLPGGLAQG